MDQLLDMQNDQLMELVGARARRRFSRGLKVCDNVLHIASVCTCAMQRKPLALIKKLRKAKKEAPEHEKPACVKTHLRNMIVVPEMIGSVVGIHNGKVFNQVEIKVCNRNSQVLINHLNYKYRLIWWGTT